MTISQPLIYSIIILNILCVFSVIYVERKNPQATISWVLVLNFLPIVGVILYIFLGNSVVPVMTKQVKRHYKNYNKYMETFKTYLNLNKKEILENEDKIIKKYSDIILLNIDNNDSMFSEDNKITLYTDAKEKYEDLFNDIENAKESINIEYFIIRNDKTGLKLVDLLAKKAKEGVIVNLLYDELGSLRTTKKMFFPIIKNGGRVCRFFSTISANLLRFNHRNHRKIVVIDGKIGYVGGMNIGNEYLGIGKLTPWRDTHLRIEGSSVYTLQVRFLLDFISSYNKFYKKISQEELNTYFPEVNFNGKLGMQIISSGPDSKKAEIKYSYLKIINSAKKSIYIETPYFVPDDALLEALKLAVMSGVDVNIMLPGKPDKMYVYYISLSYIEELLKAGINVYLYNGFIHSKSIVADGEIVTIGTTNFDVRSFMLNYEINALIYNKEFAKLNEEVFKKDILNATPLSYETFKKRNGFKKIFERILRLFSPLA